MAVIDCSDVVDDRLLSLLTCPRDFTELRNEGGHVSCSRGHNYPVVNGIPVFLLAEKEQTIGIATESLKAAENRRGYPLFVDTLGLSDDEKHGIQRDWREGAPIDSVISYLVGATSGWGYENLIGRLRNYPIPDIPIDEGGGKLLLDIGSNWGRWCVSAARKGWRVVGVDPSLGAILAAQRAFSGAGLDIAFVCADARFLPFKSDIFQGAFSYSVIQHFSEVDAKIALAEIDRVLAHGGSVKIQMAHRGGLRSTYSRTRKNYLEAGSFRVRYWSLDALHQAFENKIGPTTIVAEGFGGLGLLWEDWSFVSNQAKILIAISAVLKKLSSFVRPLIRLADSVYVAATKE